MRDITEIVLHCTATRADWWADKSTAEKVQEIRRWHMEDRGWKDIGYHYLIDRNGALATGRPMDQTGAHTKGHNTGTIGIALMGGHGSSVTDTFADNYTSDQEKALRKLIVRLHKNFGKVPVTGHNQYAAKACPGFEVPKWFEGPAVIMPTVAMQEAVPVAEPKTETVVPAIPKSERKFNFGVLIIVLFFAAAIAAYVLKG